MGSLIFCNSQPIHGSRSNRGIRIFIENLLIQLLCVGPLFFHNSHPSQSHQELRREIIFREVSFDSEALFPVLVENYDGWGPHGLKAPKPGRIFLDVNSDWDEVLFDKRGQLCITVRLGFQPSACPSGGSGAEIDQNRLVLRFGFAQSAINVFDPMNCHETLL